MNDDRISRYLHDQAAGISLTPSTPAAAVRRGTRRRTQRRVGLVGAMAVVGVLATSVAVRSTNDDQQVDLAGVPAASRSTYDWSVVSPTVGLGSGTRTAQLADGTVYSVSTAPGSYRSGSEAGYVPTLYRSSDGVEWSTATLPSGVRSAALAGAGDTLYSVGTAPAGGLVVSTSRDGTSSWTAASMPDDLEQLRARHPGEISLGAPLIAARDDTHVVVSMVASTRLDIEHYRPDYPADRYLAEWDDTGATVYETPRDDGTLGDPVASFTYDELGITGEVRDHVGGRPYVYSSDDGQNYAAARLPDLASATAEWGVSPLVTPDGYRLFLAGTDTPGGGMRAKAAVTVLRSSDGHTWDVDTTLAGSGGDVGLLAGRPAIAMWGDEGASTIRIGQPDGSWSTLDLAGAVPAPGAGWSSVSTVAFGPLGLAAIVVTSDGRDDGTFLQHVVHSTDGSSLQVVAVSDHLDQPGDVLGVVVGPDAIIVRLGTPDQDEKTPPTQKVLVGTPAG